MKNAFIAVERFKKDGELFTDAEGCFYLQPHSHPMLAGREFANPGEAIQAIRDNNNRAVNPNAMLSAKPFTGELILLNIITF